MMLMTSGLIAGVATTIAVTTSTLTFHSCRNMIQTYQRVQHYNTKLSSLQQQQPKQQPKKQQRYTIKDLEQLSRVDLLDLYLNQCFITMIQKPTTTKDDKGNGMIIPNNEQDKQQEQVLLKWVDGDWNGRLLRNNGLTFVTSFLTNQLFGRNRKWNGKSFHSSSSNNCQNNTGTNRFNVLTTKLKDENSKDTNDLSLHDHNHDGTTNHNNNKNKKYMVQEQHSFDFAIESTRLPFVRGASVADDDNDSKLKSIVIRYQRYQSFLSLWKTMVDEVRILQKQKQYLDETNTNDSSTYYNNNGYDSDTDIHDDDDDDIDIMIGLGCMSWSGGILNASPFCLYRKRKQINR